jgi:hypothetical protein
LKETFDWAKNTAISYAHDGSDPVGRWYEAALPGREAFCMRDVSHQSIGAETLGLSAHNLNMMLHFATNISEEKDWCTYWEINRYNRPAPVDYADDKHFWYTLTASPDVVQTCYRLYDWTGNSEYLSNPVLNNFYEKSLTAYLDRWKLNPDELMNRPRDMNTELPFKQGARFNGARGIPSYVEVAGGFSCGVDLVAALYAGCEAYGQMLSMRGDREKSKKFLAKAQAYKSLINEKWWNDRKGLFETSLMPGGGFLDNSQAINGLTYVIWFRAAAGPARVKPVLDLMMQRSSNLENRSHYPWLLYRCHSPENAYQVLTSLKDMKRSSYPEVSFGVMEGIVAGLMGIRPSAVKGVIQTLPQLNSSAEWAELGAVPVLGTTIGIRHEGSGKSVFTNSGVSIVKWQASFYGEYKTIKLDGKEIKAAIGIDEMADKYSYVEVKVPPGKRVTASVK